MSQDSNTSNVKNAEISVANVLPIDLNAVIASIKAQRKLIVIGAFVGMVLTVLFAFTRPTFFTAQVRIMPPSNQSSGSVQAALQGALGGAGASALGLKSPAELYVSLLKSRTLLDDMIVTFKLKELYGQQTMQGTRAVLFSITKIIAGKEGIISIDVDDQNPEQAAKLANGYFAALQRMMQRMATTEAGQKRQFFQNQLKQAKDQLTDAELAFKSMQQSTGLIQLDMQGKVAIESVAKVRATISAKEVEMASVRQYATPENPEYQRRSSELSALRSELAKLEAAQTGVGSTDKSAKKLTDSGVEYARSLRDLKYSETMFELMAKQFEYARVEEARDTASLQLIDEALVPEMKSRPNRGVIIFGGVLLTSLSVLALALFRSRKEWFKPIKG